MGLKSLAALALCAGCCMAQPYEIGGAAGYGWYRNGTIFGQGVTAQAGIRDRFAAGFVLGEDLYDYVSGEIRYLFHDGHPFLSARGIERDIQGQSHAIHYDLLVHTSKRESRLRPYFAAGAGIKGYVIAGPEPSPQPAPDLGLLRAEDEWMFLATVGVGVKYRVHRNVLLRLDLRDYMTRFPKRQIAPAGNNTARGIFQQITPLFGVSYLF